MPLPILDSSQLIAALRLKHNPFFNEYYAFYSSWYGGIVTDPHLMLLPMDDHMVHRGDGVFEAMKTGLKSVYLMDQHIERLLLSAKSVGIEHQWSLKHIKSIVEEVLQVAGQESASIRLFISRGPGNFSVNPYDSIEPQLYVMVMKLKAPEASKYELGVKIGQSHIPTKISWMSQIKSCNYLPNVLMKKEAADRDLEYVIGVDEHGFVTESFTENLMIVDKKGVIVHPLLEGILKGTTMIRACELARLHGFATAIRPIPVEELMTAHEIMMAGTGINVLPVVQFEQHQIMDGKPGPIAKKLNELLLADQQF